MFGMQSVNRRGWLLVALVLVALLVSGVAVTAQGPRPVATLHATSLLGTGFTYQGQLKQNGAPVNGTRSLAFRLYDALSGGSLLGNVTQTLIITNGLFTTVLDFGNPFNGDERYLGIAVGTDPELTPRQRLSAVPYAIHALDAWSLNGNAGTTFGNFVGTSDAMSLTLGVSGTAVLRLVPIPGAPIIIGGYSGNRVGGVSDGATIAGGGSDFFGGNLIDGGNVTWSTIGGGVNNRILDIAYQATIGGGYSNVISGTFGAAYAVIAGGKSNMVTAQSATVSGGRDNTASGTAATVAGGSGNTAGGTYSFAAGQRAKANQYGTFVWSDSNFYNFNSGGANQFDVRATGGISLVTGIDGSGNPTDGVFVAGGGSGWNAISDRSAKMNFEPVDGRQVLVQLAAIPLETWNYKTQDASIRHLGPMAQDFHAAFNVGEDSVSINSVDAQGVALAAIQGLYQIVQAQQVEIAQLKAEVSASGQAPQASRLAAQPDGLLPALVGLSLLMNVLLGLALVVHLRHAGRAPR